MSGLTAPRAMSPFIPAMSGMNMICDDKIKFDAFKTLSNFI